MRNWEVVALLKRGGLHDQAANIDLDGLSPAWTMTDDPDPPYPPASFVTSDGSTVRHEPSTLVDFSATISSLPSPDVLFVHLPQVGNKCSHFRKGFRSKYVTVGLTAFLKVSAVAAKTIDSHRPSMVAVAMQRSSWSFRSSDDVLIYQVMVNGFRNLGYTQLILTPTTDAELQFVILVADEVATRLAFPESFSTTLGRCNDQAHKLGSWPFPNDWHTFNAIACCNTVQMHGAVDEDPATDFFRLASNIADFFRPRSSFRVTKLEQVWPVIHQQLFKDWQVSEAARATLAVQGKTTPVPPVVVLDSVDLHPLARHIQWDMRPYWEHLDSSGASKPELIVPLFSYEAVPNTFNNEAISALTLGSKTPFSDMQTVHDLEFGMDNQAEPAEHSLFAGNWPDSYHYYTLGTKGIDDYLKHQWLAHSDRPAFLPLTVCARNSVRKPGEHPDVKRRDVNDLKFPDGIVTHAGKTFSMLSLNSRSKIEKQAPLTFSSFDQFEAKAVRLARSQLKVVMMKIDGDAWYKQFKRRVSQIADGVIAWPDFTKDVSNSAMFVQLTARTELPS